MNNFLFDYTVKEPSLFNQNSKVILMFHGYGSNKEDLFTLSNHMNPELLIISIQAPLKLDYNSYCWWSLQYDDKMRLKMDRKQATEIIFRLDQFISSELIKKYNFSFSQIYLMGFSQGCMISYVLSINFPKKYKKVIGLSGKIPHEIIKFDKEQNYSNHNFFCSHGINDQVIPIEIGRESESWLSKNKINHKYLEFDAYHNINPQNFKQINLWIKNN